MIRYELDLAKPLSWDLLWLIPAFVVHSVIPLHWRRAFLLGVTAILLVRILGTTAAAYAIASGLTLIGLCHLPLAFRWRVVLILIVATVLALIQLKMLDGSRFLLAAMPILGGMFMFRLYLYLYDVRHEKRESSTPLERISYFFLLPAPLAPFFPVIDYPVYARSYYQRPSFETYQSGMLWISRGVVHLALYRVIYHYFSPAVEQVTDLAGVAAFCLSGYLIYLRVSGLFHIIAGALRIFGYAIPETHHLYFFARDFSDYWRRINIYWKEFMAKIAFFPTFSILRRTKFGYEGRMVLSTISVFVITTILHSYQTFWLRGSFEIHETDYGFWGILGILVIATNLAETRRSGKKIVKGWDWRRATILSVRTLGMFVLLMLIWALWSSQEWRVFGDVMSQARNAPGWQIGMLLGIAAALVILGTLGQWFAHLGFNLFESKPGLKRSVATTAVPLAILAIAWQIHFTQGLPGWLGTKFEAVWIDQPNARDAISKERSYYEGLLAGSVSVGAEEEKLVKDSVDDIRGMVYQKNFGPEEVWGAQWSTNRWGMRDQFHSKPKVPGIYRVAFSGASYVAGRGVKDGANFESLLEERMNADGKWMESLNFATAGYGSIQRLADLEIRILEFNPDAFFLVCHGGEMNRNLRSLAQIRAQGEDALTYPFLKDLFKRAGVKDGDSQTEIIRALTPFSKELMQWTYRRIAEVCREHEIAAVWVYLPQTQKLDMQRVDECLGIVREAGITALVLEDAYGGRPADEIIISDADHHPNELGHQLITESLLQKIEERRDEIGIPVAAKF
jgi:hypothetical protein